MRRLLGGGAAAIAALLIAVPGGSGALAYQPGAIGYDISYPQCSGANPSLAGPMPTSTGQARNPIPPSVPTATTREEPSTSLSPSPTKSVVRTSIGLNRSAPPAAPGFSRGYGIVGVDNGRPFILPTNSGNPCLVDEYRHTPNPGLYINTGYAPSYTDSTHLTADCSTKSAAVPGNGSQKTAWAVGCSEAQRDLAYVTAQGIVSVTGWWLDVELANSWCGQSGTNCADKTLNQYSLQGLIDTLLANRASPVGIYSTDYMWSAITGGNPVHGQTADWYATVAASPQAAAPYCSSSYSFTGDPVKLVQFGNGTFDLDYAC